MKIAMIAPVWLPIPPAGYGGIELVVYDLVEGLAKRGHEVLVYGTGDSHTSGNLIPLVPKHIGQDWPEQRNALNGAFAEAGYAQAFLAQADIVHDHTYHHSTSNFGHKVIHTLHGPVVWGLDKAVEMSKETRNTNYFAAISDRQRELYCEGTKEHINWMGTVYNGIDVDSIPFTPEKEDYVLFVGRANWEKGLDLAVRVAVKAGKRLVMAVKMTERFEQEYFKQHVEPYLAEGNITVLGEITPKDKFDLYLHAKGTIFSSQWEEPYGLVMPESMACGTPVVALRRGAAPELIKHGETGFLCDTEEEMVEAVKKFETIDPYVCREHVRKNFSVDQMVEGYLKVYEQAIKGDGLRVTQFPSLEMAK